MLTTIAILFYFIFIELMLHNGFTRKILLKENKKNMGANLIHIKKTFKLK